MRLNRYLSLCGAASRRQADRLIEEGRITVNGVPERRLGITVDPDRAAVLVDGRPVRPPRRRSYWLFHKPAGCLCSRGDPWGRPTIYDLLPAALLGLKYVGRLDQDTEGLLLLTDDGELSDLLTHPSSRIPRTYRARVQGVLRDRELNPLRQGAAFEGLRYQPAEASTIRADSRGQTTELEITIREGKKREVRNMMRVLGHRVLGLRRIGFGPLALGRIAPGEVRELASREVAALQAAVRTADLPRIALDLPRIYKKPRR